MSIAFYKSIIEDEIKVFGIKEESLKQAAVSVGKTYSKKSLKRGETFLDYNIPSNRCAYLYKYASIHTGLVSKYFLKLLKKKEVKSSLRKKETLKICCLGGGPGTDIVGLFQTLSLIPYYHKKVTEVTVLDICGGWRNSFKRIISSLIEGKVKNVPEAFVNASNFKFKLIEVNLLNDLPSNIVTILSEADIVCMVKFVSAILGFSTSVSSLQVIGERLKVGAAVLFIDNFQGSIFKPFLDISGLIGLQIMLGPLHEVFVKKLKSSKITANESKTFGCLPLGCTRVTVLGFIKTDKVHNTGNSFSDLSSRNLICNNEDTDDSWSTEDESENSVKETLNKSLQYSVKMYHDKFTQTDKAYFSECSGLSANIGMETKQTSELCSLIDNLCELMNVLSQWKQQLGAKKHCCHCH